MKARIQYDEKLVETAVFLCTSGVKKGRAALEIQRFQREREQLYGIRDPEMRDGAFYQLHLKWFREWGFEKLLLDLSRDFDWVQSGVHRLVFRSVLNKNDEGGELFIKESSRTAVLAFQARRFADEPGLCAFLRHEFLRLDDMLDPSFEYTPELAASARGPAHQTLTRERYRLLWNVSIDGRTTLRGHAPLQPRERHFSDFARTYSFWDAQKIEETFDLLWNERAPRHGVLIELAADPRGLADSRAPIPGALCSLCGFPTFEWSPVVPGALAVEILRHFPGWTPEQGVCARCFEIYVVTAKMSSAAA